MSDAYLRSRYVEHPLAALLLVPRWRCYRYGYVKVLETEKKLPLRAVSEAMFAFRRHVAWTDFADC